MNNSTRTRRDVARNSIRSATRAVLFESMERRQLMSADSVKVIDTAGPDHEMVEANGTVYAISSTRSGGGWSQLLSTKGSAKSTRTLIDLNASGAKLGSLESLMTTADGRVFFTATGGDVGGRQLYQLNTAKGGYTQITRDAQAFYTQSQVIGNTIYLYDSTHERIMSVSGTSVKKVVDTEVVRMYQAKGQLFYAKGDQGLYRTNGTAAGTYKVNGNLVVSPSDVFVSNDYLYFEGTAGNQIGLWRADGSNVAPTRIADDFYISVNDSVEIGDHVYFAGAYYNTSPNARGGELYRIRTSTGELTPATDLANSNGGGAVDGISAVGKNVYFVAGDGEFITGQGTTDRELYRYDTIAGTTTLITDQNTVYPIEQGAGVLSNYYFVAAPTKGDARFGSRALYRTSPSNDEFELVRGLPSYQDSNDVTRQLVGNMLGGSAGLYYAARNTDVPGDYDTYFVATPYSYVDPVTKVLNVDATTGNDVMSVTVDADELIMNLNGIEERQPLSAFTTIFINMKAGDDKLTANVAVTRGMSVNGDGGNDTLTTGGGNDSILGGSGKNFMYGQAGDDRLRGSAGYDYAEGGDGIDRIYGRGGSDNLHGNNGVDVLYGDDAGGAAGNDTLFGESSNDKLYGYGGDDVFYGGNQNDSIFGGEGNDLLYGQAGNDTLDGGLGLDRYFGDLGNDLFLANDGQLDELDGGAGTDTATRDDDEKIVKLIEV